MRTLGLDRQRETVDMFLETKVFKKLPDLQVTEQNWLSCSVNTMESSGSKALELLVNKYL